MGEAMTEVAARGVAVADRATAVGPFGEGEDAG
jgi:hypothetical protein